MNERSHELHPGTFIIPAEEFRELGFETGGTDIWGDATDEELDISEAARNSVDPKTTDSGFVH